jgi:hypothetical protein
MGGEAVKNPLPSQEFALIGFGWPSPFEVDPQLELAGKPEKSPLQRSTMTFHLTCSSFSKDPIPVYCNATKLAAKLISASLARATFL